MNLFLAGFWILSVICSILFLYTRTKLSSITDVGFKQFQRVYLTVYIMAMAGDWLQGPHVYALYESYGMSTSEIETLFIAGFGSSMLFGTVVGSFADKYGRRTNCILYGILYGGACITKHFNNFNILMLGRLLGGIATSVLYSAFESWMVCEHFKRGFDQESLGNTFSYAVLGNSLIAIISGLVAQYFADLFGFVAPFDVSLTTLTVMTVIIILTWSENYGDKTLNLKESFVKAFQSIKSDPKVLCLGLIQSLFEGSMYIFVLEWTPALEPPSSEPPFKNLARKLLENTQKMTTDGHRGSIPHGQIFAAFMVAIMIGSSLFRLLNKYTSVESFMRPVLFVAAISLGMPVIFKGNQYIVFSGFIIFEVCVGIFWPSLGTMRGKYVPEETRATIMNFFRVPLNLIVVVILNQHIEMKSIFQCCVVFLMCATGFQQWLYSLYKQLPAGSQQAEVKVHPIKGDLTEIVPGEEKVPLHEDDEQEVV